MVLVKGTRRTGRRAELPLPLSILHDLSDLPLYLSFELAVELSLSSSSFLNSIMPLLSLLRRRRGKGNQDLVSHRRRGRDREQDGGDDVEEEEGEEGHGNERAQEEVVDVTKELIR